MSEANRQGFIQWVGWDFSSSTSQLQTLCGPEAIRNNLRGPKLKFFVGEHILTFMYMYMYYQEWYMYICIIKSGTCTCIIKSGTCICTCTCNMYCI